jgi:outer membrane protein G
MKNILTIGLLFSALISSGQAYTGREDSKLNIGLTVQNGGRGVVLNYDQGLGENISVGILTSYLLAGNNIKDVSFDYRFDAKVRFNANLGNVVNISPKFDVYPGLNLGLKNFGGHLGARYFFTEGFGIYTDFSAPFALYNPEAKSKYNNGVSFNIGASFNLN